MLLGCHIPQNIEQSDRKKVVVEIINQDELNCVQKVVTEMPKKEATRLKDLFADTVDEEHTSLRNKFNPQKR